MPRNSDKRGYIGIDIGGTKTLYALFDESFEVIVEEKLRTAPQGTSKQAFARGMTKTVKALLARARKEGITVRRVGVGCAGDIDMAHGVVRASPNIPFIDGFELRDHLEKLTEAKVFVGHDVQAGLYGEFRMGAARKGRHVIGVWIGTGVGGALIIDGKLHLGATGCAGDIGNYLLHAVDVDPDSPRTEVLDSVASRTAIVGQAAVLAAKQAAPVLRERAGTDVSDIRAGDIADAIKKGDKAIEKLVRSRAAVVGAALSNLVDFLNPDHVVLGGGLVEALPNLMKREVQKAIEAHAAKNASKALRVVVAKLGGHAGTIGAACMAVDMFAGAQPVKVEPI